MSIFWHSWRVSFLVCNSFEWLSYQFGMASSWHRALQLSGKTNELQHRESFVTAGENFWVAGSYDSSRRCTLHTAQRVDKLLQAARNGGEWCSKGYPGVVVEPLAVHKRNGSNNKLGNQLSVRNGNFAGSQDKWLVRQAGQRGQGGEREGRELTCCSRRGRKWVKHTASWARDLSRRFRMHIALALAITGWMAALSVAHEGRRATATTLTISQTKNAAKNAYTIYVAGSGASPSPHAAVHPRAVQYALHVPWRRSRRSSNSSRCLRPGSAGTPPASTPPKEPLQPGTTLLQVVKWLLFT